MDTETKSHKKRKKQKRIGRTILTILGFLLLFLLTVALTIGFLTIRPPDVSDKNQNTAQSDTKIEERTDGRYSVLVVGTDDAGLNTDTILVASLDSKQNIASVMSIPRDTMSNVTRNVKKINAAYAVGAKDGVGNIDNLKKEISYLMGFPVDNYVIIDLSAFEELIDALGGVTIDVPMDMHYDDPYQALHIHIDKGLQTLNGKDAMGFVRYRKGYTDGDLGRVKAQQLFIQALAEQVATPATITKLPLLADIILDNMRTDLTYGELAWFAKEAASVDMSTNLHMFTLPGVAEMVKPEGSYQRLSYYLPYEDEILEIVNQYFNPYSRDLVSLNVVDTDALLLQAGIQREELKKQEEAENTENGEDIIELDENGNPIAQPENSDSEDSEKESTDEENNTETNNNEGNNNVENNNDETNVNQEQNEEHSDAVEGNPSDEPVIDPNTQAPDEVLKSEAEQNTVPVEDPANASNDNSSIAAPENNTANAENTSSEEITVPSGGIPGEVLKSDLE